MTTFYLDYENGNDSNDGSSWALAWKTITNGATAARIAPGDVIRIAKSPDPYSIGNATWTDLSKTVTLATAQTLTIDNCETAWTANPLGDATVTRDPVATDAKQGSYCMRITLDASPQVNTLQAYYTITSTDFSAYQKISFWFKNEAAVIANNWKICLCSDTAGATPVDTFDIPAVPSTGYWLPLTLARSGGGNLGAAIRSIAIYTGSDVTGMASKYVRVDDFIACTTGGLNLQSLISKNNLAQGGSEGWYGIQSINGTTILLDNHTNCKANEGRGYSNPNGAINETVATYARETIKTTLATALNGYVQVFQKAGTSGNRIVYSGGYNTTTNARDGETFFDGLNGLGTGIRVESTGGSKNFLEIEGINTVRYGYGFALSVFFNDSILTIQTSGNNTVTALECQGTYKNTIVAYNLINTGNGAYGINGSGLPSNTITVYNSSNGLAGGILLYSDLFLFARTNNNVGNGLEFARCGGKILRLEARNNTQSGAYFNLSGVINELVTSNNGYACSSSLNYHAHVSTVFSATVSESLAFFNYSNSVIAFQKFNGGLARYYTDGASAIQQVATAGGTGNEWKLYITSSNRNSAYPFKFPIAQVAVNAGSLVTVKLYFKKSHATDIAACLATPGGELAGVSETTAIAPSDTNRNQVTLTFTPSAAGVVSIEARAWWAANTADENVIIDDISISQA